MRSARIQSEAARLATAQTRVSVPHGHCAHFKMARTFLWPKTPSNVAQTLLSVLLMLATTAAIAQPIAATNRGIVVAHDGVIELFDRTGRNLIWKTDGVPTPQTIAASNERIAVLDPLANEARIVDLATGRGTSVNTGETPIAGIFIGPTLYLLERDARALERIGADGTRASISTGADPAFLHEWNGRLYVYARGEGVVQEITTSPF